MSSVVLAGGGQGSLESHCQLGSLALLIQQLLCDRLLLLLAGLCLQLRLLLPQLYHLLAREFTEFTLHGMHSLVDRL